MRNKLRIKPFLERVDIGMLLAHSDLKFDSPEEAIELGHTLTSMINSDLFIEHWIDNCDLRFAQALSTFGDDYFDCFFYKEEHELLQLCGYTENESHMWVSNYNEDGTLREEPVCRFIDQLDNTHLFRMIDEANNFKRIYPVKYLLLFERELCDRGFCNVLVSQKALDWASEGAERWNLDILKTILKLNEK